jgi:hypothetical protein
MKEVAVVTYLDKNERLIKEFNWLYRSWVVSGSWLTSDLVVFHHPEVQVHNVDLITIPLEPINTQAKWKDYPFINSVYYLGTLQAEFLKEYKYILRTDHDCFLTPNFPSLRPRLATFGIGMYAQEPSVVVKLAQIAEKWGILPNFNNVGSTVMAYSGTVLAYAKLHMEYCERLLADEFPTEGKWPGWFKGVLSMYAGNLAANAYFGMGLTFGGLDCHCMSLEPMCATDYHIHAWHTYDFFSKFKWHDGGYSNIDTNTLDKRIIANYCLAIAGATP